MYRALTEIEIAVLSRQGCTAHDWQLVQVAEGFDPQFVRNVTFGGRIALGVNGNAVNCGGVVRPSGLYNVALYDCTLGDGVLISNVGRFIAHYDIGDRVVIENVGQISCEGRGTFGNGVEVAAINEGGGREVPIYDELTAQVAYLMAMYRHRTRTIDALRGMIRRIVDQKSASRGRIGEACTIVNTTSLLDVAIGAYATVDGASTLRNGTINSSKESPSYVGSGVAARDFILARCARVDTGVMLRSCYVGEGVLIENGFSAEQSLFFANSHCTHGEACAVFAGPYTVTHHRATLLIAGYFSFFNAGSGANQSNHMYKSGPVHQGVHLRGCKFSSDAYILLPASTGVFSVVKGRHYQHHDTDRMPFSYLIEERDDSYLLPGMNLRSYGTLRDIRKWPRRDRRQGVSHDIIRYELMTPYTAGKIIHAIRECEFLLARYPTVEEVTWNRVKIKVSALRKGLLLYTQALRSYLAELLVSGGVPQLASVVADVTVAAPDAVIDAVADVATAAADDGLAVADVTSVGQSNAVEHPATRAFVDFSESDPGLRDWIDVAGMIVPSDRIGRLLDRVDSGEVGDVRELAECLQLLDDEYHQLVDGWAVYALEELLHKPAHRITVADIRQVIEQGNEDRKALEAAVEMDAHRDFAPLMAVGYGIDSDEHRAEDFRAVRGEDSVL